MDKQCAYIVTGATGFLGRRLVKKLLDTTDYSLILLIRSKDGLSASDRFFANNKALLKYRNRICITDTTLQRVLDLIEDGQFTTLSYKHDIKGVWHLAANLSFRSRDSSKVIDTNVQGTENIIKLALFLNTTLFYVSTAYVHGKRCGLLLEEEIYATDFNNDYEVSKFQSENLIKKYQLEANLKSVIFRPSIIIDNNYTNLNIFNPFGYYAILDSVYDLKHYFITFFRKHVVLAKIFGVVEHDNILRIRFIPFFTTNTRINLVPLDIVVDTMLEISLSDDNNKGKTFHLVSPLSTSMIDVIRVSFDALDFHMPIVVLPTFIVYSWMYLIQVLSKIIPPFVDLSKKLHYYGYYLTHDYNFNITNVTNIVGEEYYKTKFNNFNEYLFNCAKAFISLKK